MEVRLREVRQSDLEWINKIRNDYQVSKFLNLFCPQSLDEEIAWFSNDKDNEVHFAIERSDEEWQIVGQVSLVGYKKKDRKAELTIFLHPNAWGQKIGTTATKLMTHYGFTQLNLNKIFLHCYSNNERAYRLYQKLGFESEGVLRDFVYKDGTFYDAIHFGMLRSEFDRIWWQEEISQPLIFSLADSGAQSD
jgi:diamine N-acetyltransferase